MAGRAVRATSSDHQDVCGGQTGPAEPVHHASEGVFTGTIPAGISGTQGVQGAPMVLTSLDDIHKPTAQQTVTIAYYSILLC